MRILALQIAIICLTAGSLFAQSNTRYCVEASTNLAMWATVTPTNAVPPQMFLRVHTFNPPAGAVMAAGGILVSTNATTTMIGLTWSNASANATGINIQRALSSNGTWSAIAVVPGSITSFLDNGMPCCTSYWYRVDATNSEGASPWSNIAGPAVPVYKTFLQGQWQ
jgi:hypothetical protein